MNTRGKYPGIAALFLPTLLWMQGFADAKAPSPYVDPLVWDDLVVRGRVVAVEKDVVPATTWYSPGTLKYGSNRGDVDVISLKIRIFATMRGKVSGDEMTMLHRRFADARDELLFDQGLRAGDDVIVTAAYNEQLANDWIWMDLYAKKQNGWCHFEPERGWSDCETEDGLVQRAGIASLRQVTRLSDVVLKGTIVSRKTVDGSSTRDQEYVVRPVSFVKGATTTDNLMVRALGAISQDQSKWRELLPFEMEVGTSWYLFLMKKDDAFVPAAGRHSALLIKDGRLIERLTVPSKYQPSELERDVRRFSTE